MRKKTAIWGVLAAIAVIALSFLSPPIPRAKARAPRIAGVNTVRSVSLTLTNTNALSVAQRGIGK